MTAMPTSPSAARGAETAADLRYQSGFGNEFATEVIAGALPQGQNSPQRAPLGLIAEQITGTPFTAPRAQNRRTWVYRIRPSAMHPPFRRLEDGLLRSAPITEAEAPPNRLRWNPLPRPETPADFVASLVTVGAAGDVGTRNGVGLHVYRATRSMERVFVNADGELLFIPQQGGVTLHTELGVLSAAPGEIAVIPRGVKFRVQVPAGGASGWVCENYGAYFRLPELGPLGSNGLANARDFLTPHAAFEDVDAPTELVTKFDGHLWVTELAHSPLDVVAWHGNYAPYKYDLARFNGVGTVSYDHPDPSIYTVLTSPSEVPGTANCDFVIFPPRWMVAENTFRPPWFHRNVMSEFFGLIQGVYDGKAEGLVPGGMSLHNSLQGHGPDVPTFEKASTVDLKPHKLDGSLAFLCETRYVIRPTRFALETPALQRHYDQVWAGFKKRFPGG